MSGGAATITSIKKPSRWKRTKMWAKHHKDDLIAASMIGGFVAGTVAVLVAVAKADNRARERSTAELNSRIDDLNAWMYDERERQIVEGH